MTERVGIIALSPGYTSLALVKYADCEGWQFPSKTVRQDEAPEHAAVEVAAMLGLPEEEIKATLCIEPALHALGPLPGHSTKFLLAFDVTERDLAPPAAAPAADAEAAPAAAAAAAAGVPTEAVWRSLQELRAESEGQPIHGNQLVAVLKQLQHLFKRLPDPASLLGQHEELAGAMFWQEQPGTWHGPAPKDYLASWCKQQGLPVPCYNVFEQGKGVGKIHFSATCLLPHVGLQLTPDAAYRTPLEAIHNSAILAALYLEGALPLDCPLVHFASAGNMARVPHAHLTRAEVEENEAADAAGGAERQRARREQELQQRVSQLQRQLANLRKQPPELVAPGQIEQLSVELAQTQRTLELSRPARGPGAGQRGVPGDRPLWPGADKAARPAPFPPAGPPAAPKRPRPEPPTLPSVLASFPPDKNAIMAVKEVCDKLRWVQPQYTEVPRGNLWAVSASLPETGMGPVEGGVHADRKQAKLLAAEVLLARLKQQAAQQPGSAPAPLPAAQPAPAAGVQIQ